jgi:16S rRNA (cytosine967-C5)-methyltransferase
VAAISPTRKAAFQVLLSVERGHSHSDNLLRGRAINALSAVDRNLATALVLGVLRWQICLDAELRPLFKRPGARLDPEVLIALRLGAFQLLHMDRIPTHAAIDESVELTRQAGHRFASGMVNAVLRRMAAARTASPLETLAPELAASQAHPAWMVDRWTRFYGIEAAREICRHGQTQPAQIIRVAGSDIAEELMSAGVEMVRTELLAAARRVVSGDVTATAAFREGRAWFQDEGSQLVAEIAGHGSEILDCCAAPGGKTLILAARNPEARIVASERSPQRHEQLRRRMAARSDRIECRVADVTELAEDRAYDLALADVPCSGTGTLGRNPEIRHRLRVEDLARQTERQGAILMAALRAVRPGGRVVYSTCSLEPEENEDVIAAVLERTTGVRVSSMAASIDAMHSEGALADGAAEKLRGCVTAESALRLLPGVFRTDGFFVCVLERVP